MTGKALRARKRVRGAPTHTISVRLDPAASPTPGIHRRLEARFHAGARVYNAVLAEFMDRSTQVKTDPAHAAALERSSQTKNERAERNRALTAVRESHGFTESSAMGYASGLREAWVREHVPAQEAQALGKQAFAAVADHHFGRKGRPRFKPTRHTSRGLRSMRSKDTHGALRPWRDTTGAVAGIRWGDPARGGLVLLFTRIRGHGRKAAELTAERHRLAVALEAGGLLYVRLVRSRIRGRWTYTAQFVLDGPAPVRHDHPPEDTRGCFDLGPSQVSIAHTIMDPATGVETWTSQTVPLAPGLAGILADLRRAQRRLDRQHRAASPACFNADGTHKRVCGWTDRSTRAQVTAAQIGELHRKAAAHRTHMHGHLTNRMAETATDWSAERLSYRSWQKNFSGTVRDRAPGEFVAVLRRKAASAGDSVRFTDLDPWSLALSQHCVCGDRRKKSLNERTHRCGNCGLTFHRDEFSAYLGLHVSPTQAGIVALDPEAATAMWTHRSDASVDLLGRLPRADAPECRGRGAYKRRGRRPSPRSLARIRARQALKRQSRSADKTGQPAPTAPRAAA